VPVRRPGLSAAVTASDATAITVIAVPVGRYCATVPASVAPTACITIMPVETRPSACPLISSGVIAISRSWSSSEAA
jgi:hypothetical protein